MISKRPIPWIYRYSRFIIGAIATIGATITSYLTITKLTGGEVVCSTNAAEAASTCGSVLNSPYATVFGLPLSLFGCLAYLSMISFALSPYLINSETKRQLRNQVEHWTWLLLLVGGTSMAVFSSYLMYVLFFKLETFCLYCITSALFSLSFLVLTIIGREWEDLGQIFFTGITVSMITILATLAIYSNVNNPNSASGKTVIPKITTQPQPPMGWEIVTTSGASEIALAEHLTASKVKMYGAFWCPHCYDQKLLFGKEAFHKINYVECDPQGVNPQTQACIDAGVKGYPTWEIKGKIDGGVKPLEKLAQLSNYNGKKDFKYTLPEN